MIGSMFPTILGAIDLSIGAQIAFTNVSVAVLVAWHGVPLLIAIFIVIGINLLIGFAQGRLITQFSPPLPFVVPSVVITLSVMFILSGLATEITKGFPITGLPKAYFILGSDINGFPVPLITLCLITIITTYILHFSKLGRHIYAVGGRAEAAALAGVNVRKIREFCFTYAALLYGVSGLTLGSLIQSGNATVGPGYLLPSIAGVAIGGVSLAGGEGNIMMPIIGALLIYLIENILVMMGFSPFWHEVILGGIFIVVAIIDFYRRKKSVPS
jgi:ribose/xylose/arabinose/galactoside ABC-type transport system permease subunit